MNDTVIDFDEPQPYVRNVLRYQHGGAALDVGAGWGRNARFLAANGFEVTAVDTDSEALAELDDYAERSGAPIITHVCDIRTFRPHREYDVVVCTMTLHFVTSQAEFEAALAMLKAATAPDGILVASTYTARNRPRLRPYLPPPRFLRDQFESWRVLEAYEGYGRWMKRPDRTRTRAFVERVIARKR